MSQVSDLNRSIWLVLLTKGGWWSAGDAEAELQQTSGSLYQRMRKMKMARSLDYRPRTRARAAQFAVTPICTVPQGITVGEILQATEAKLTRPRAEPGELGEAELHLLHTAFAIGKPRHEARPA